MSTRFKHQYITAYVVLLPITFAQFEALPVEEQEVLNDKLIRAESAAYALVDAQYRKLPGYSVPSEHRDDHFNIERYELCANDIEATEIRGKWAHGIGIYTEHRLDAPAVGVFAQLVFSAFKEVAPGFGFEAQPITVNYQVTNEVTEEQQFFVDETPYLKDYVQ